MDELRVERFEGKTIETFTMVNCQTIGEKRQLVIKFTDFSKMTINLDDRVKDEIIEKR